VSAVVFAEQPVRPVPPNMLAGWERYGLQWTGADGSVWDLRNWRTGVFVTTEGLLGLDDPNFEIQAQESPAVHGRTRENYRIAARPVEIPLYVYNDDTSREWQQLYRAIRNSFHPLKPGTLQLTSPLGVRTIELYLDGNGDFSYTRDPIFEGHSRYRIRCTAEFPLWRGETISRRFSGTVPILLFNPDGFLHIGPRNVTSSAAIDNTGEEPAWTRITVNATGAEPLDASITIDGGELGLPTIPAGSQLVVDTDPTVGSAELDAVDVDADVDPWDPRPVPPGTAVPLDLSLDGDGEVIVELTPLHWRGL